MSKCFDSIPTEQIRVFISSAQNDEEDFSWSDVRRNIKNSLLKCNYFLPFIIEDEASIDPSLQFFQRQIMKADIVVFLIKGEIRRGTQTEIALVERLNKPKLVYFFEDEKPSREVLNFKKSLQDKDKCTYRNFLTTDNIGDEVRKDLMNNIVRTFQEKYNQPEFEEKVIGTNLANEFSTVINGTPLKTDLAKFESCYNHIYKLIGYSFFAKETEESDYHALGCALLEWLTDGKWCIQNEDISKMIDYCENVYNNTDCLRHRWDAIVSAQRGDLRKALAFEEKALEIAKKDNEPRWIINSILIDCRNIENAISSEKKEFVFNSVFQEEIDNQEQLINMPVLDRYLNNIYEQTERDRFRVDTATAHTRLLGSGFSSAVKEMVSYLFVAALYGSFTHLHLSRTVYAGLLIQYSKIAKEYEFGYEGLKQFILAGNGNDYKLYINSSWDILFPFIVTKADKLWEYTDKAPIQYQESIKIMVFLSVGMYMTDSCFMNAADYLYGLATSLYACNSDLYFAAIQKNLNRMNSEKVIKALIPIIAEHRFSLADKISHILLYINLEAVSFESLQKLAEVMKENLPLIINRNGDPQMIVALVERDPQMFSFLETMDENGLIGRQEILYHINKGEDEWISFLEKEIEEARIQFEENCKDGVFHGFSHDPYQMISRIIDLKKSDSKLEQLLLEKYSPLAVDVINSTAAVQTKETCIIALNAVLAFFNEKGIKIPDDLVDSIKNIDLNKGMDFSIFTTSRRTLEIRVLMAKALCGIVSLNALLQWCVNYNAYTSMERVALIECIEKYLSQNLESTDSLISYIVLQCSTDKCAEVRRIAYSCMAHIISALKEEIMVDSFCAGIYDPAASVRETVLTLCEKNRVPNEIAASCIELLSADANYYIYSSTRK